MIGTDTPMALEVRGSGTNITKQVIYLGYATLDGNEYNLASEEAEKNGNYTMLIECDDCVGGNLVKLLRLVREVK
jgi:hypothetical protein